MTLMIVYVDLGGVTIFFPILYSMDGDGLH